MDAGKAAINIVARITERVLFRRMVDIGVGPEESMKVMAFWMWLEAQGFKELVRKISSNNDKFLKLVADEAEAVLATLEPGSTSLISRNLCPITSVFFSPFSIHDIFRDKESVSKGVADIRNGVCCVIFNDVLGERGAKVRVSGDDGHGVGNAQAMLTKRSRQFGECTSKEGAMMDLAGLRVPFHEGLEKTRARSELGEDAAVTVLTKLNPFAREWNPAKERSPEEERCLFLTFSKGNALTENQIINFLNGKYGACVERAYVHRPNPNAPALFGKVVFNSCWMPTAIMDKREQTKFSVDGKPLWCKRFVVEKKGLGNKRN
ncbi:hypothetical protein CJ030_MR1G025745 [Morella rubra]|uniref:Uncharacterized protein n=1 Tax=Morella rubra TaxID=262757 RepID=A0A6A1WIW3_9ROSI|nr:hypothetical protein CJ030_MR1G025745 [Morella rubra]